MSGDRCKNSGFWWLAPASGAFLGLALAAGSATGAGAIDPDADKVLQSMSTYLGGQASFSVSADVDTEFVDLQGQKLQLTSNTAIGVERPARLHVRRQGVVTDMEMIYDGNLLTLFGKKANAYFQVESPGTIDDVVDAVRSDIGLHAPGADLMYADPYSGLISGVTSGDYYGTAMVNGVECHHLAFREEQVDWQLWVKTGDEPLPMKYVITTKWVTGAPQHSIRFRDWDTNPQLDAKQFAFSAPQGATRLEAISVEATGDPMIGGGAAMTIKANIRTIVIASAVMAAGLGGSDWYLGDYFISEAHARPGRPMTPTSVAGVARRTTRRTIRRTNRYVATLPRSCTTVVIDGTKLHHCGSTYYQSYNKQYVVVNVD